jgi:hypothetical protein
MIWIFSSYNFKIKLFQKQVEKKFRVINKSCQFNSYKQYANFAFVIQKYIYNRQFSVVHNNDLLSSSWSFFLPCTYHTFFVERIDISLEIKEAIATKA